MRRTTELKRTGFLKRSHPLRASNPERVAKRRKRYQTHMRSPEWKAIRLERFTLDGFRCTARDYLPLPGIGEGRDLEMGFRCEVEDPTRTGKGLHCHHRGSAHFGSEEPRHLMTLCPRHHELIESQLRPWNRGRSFK